ncbi:MAG: HNH endonuclease signature motif containing protein [Cyanobacteria bacterium]|nr:HNH endonuclease signature motif containing protein [Cyanobacteriota bacterium]
MPWHQGFCSTSSTACHPLPPPDSPAPGAGRSPPDPPRLVGGEEVGCLLTQKPAASGTGAATARRSAARSNTGCSPGPRAAANAAAQAVAWQTPHQRALEVDHIVPRNQGGSDDLSNLQAFCFRCNAGTLKGPGRRSALRSSSPVGRPRP